VNWDQALEVVPDGFLKCACAEPHPSDPAGIVVHPPKEVADTAAPQDVLVLSYVDYTSLGGVKKSGESYDIRRGTYRQSFTISPASSVYTAIAGVSAIPAVVGIILAVLLGLIPRKKATGT